MILDFSVSEKIRLDLFLRRELPKKVQLKQLNLNQTFNDEIFSNGKIRRLIVCGAVSVNSKQIKRPAFELRGFSKVCVDFDEKRFFYEKVPNDIKFEVTKDSILYEDEYLICLNKPTLFPTEETIVGCEKRDNLHASLVRYLWKKNPSLRNPPYAGIMHRLDRETSGVILFTKQRSVNVAIQKMFENHEIAKTYELLCSSTKNSQIPNSFCVEMFLGRISSKSQAAKWGFLPENKGGVYSKTSFFLKDKEKFSNNSCFRLEAQLFTGRTHQIRVHLSSQGFPIVGDELYGGIQAKRIMLHSKKLEFVHPILGTKILVEAKVPF